MLNLKKLTKDLPVIYSLAVPLAYLASKTIVKCLAPETEKKWKLFNN